MDHFLGIDWFCTIIIGSIVGHAQSSQRVFNYLMFYYVFFPEKSKILHNLAAVGIFFYCTRPVFLTNILHFASIYIWIILFFMYFDHYAFYLCLN